MKAHAPESLEEWEKQNNEREGAFRQTGALLIVVVFALIWSIYTDLSGTMREHMHGMWFGAISVLLAIYFLGAGALFRFIIARRPIHLALTYAFTIILIFGWFGIRAVIDGGAYRSSFLFVICFITAFKIMRFPEKIQETKAAK